MGIWISGVSSPGTNTESADPDVAKDVDDVVVVVVVVVLSVVDAETDVGMPPGEPYAGGGEVEYWTRVASTDFETTVSDISAACIA